MTRPSPVRGFGWGFVAGCLLTWLCMTLLRRFEGASSGSMLDASSSRKEGRFQGIGPPEHLGLSPLALRAQSGTGTANVSLDRLIVAVRHNEDTSWLDTYLSEIPHVVYHNADPIHTAGAQHATLLNKGTEAMGYLQFIVDYYDSLPASIAFIHGHRHTWHLGDRVPLLRRLRWGEVPFANLRFRNGPNNRLPWLCAQQSNESGWREFDCNWVGSFLYPTSARPRQAGRIHAMNKDEWFDSLILAQTWDQNFGPFLGPLPPVMRSPCCGEFLVSRERIMAHPRAFYVHLRDWIVGTELDWTTSGRVFEHTWPLIFGEPAVVDPVEECLLLACNETEALLAAQPTHPSKMHYITTSNSAEDAMWAPGALSTT